MEDWVILAVLIRPRGIRGEIVADSLAEAGSVDRYQNLNEITVLDPVGKLKGVYGLEDVWPHQGRLVFKLRGVDSMNDAEDFRGCQVVVPKSQRAPLEEGAFYYSDLAGCMMVDDATGDPIGTVLGWVDTGGPGILEVEGGLLVPFAKSICKAILPDQKLIRVTLPEGLRELN